MVSAPTPTIEATARKRRSSGLSAALFSNAAKPEHTSPLGVAVWAGWEAGVIHDGEQVSHLNAVAFVYEDCVAMQESISARKAPAAKWTTRPSGVVLVKAGKSIGIGCDANEVAATLGLEASSHHGSRYESVDFLVYGKMEVHAVVTWEAKPRVIGRVMNAPRRNLQML
jgi:hypothetical protein